MKRFLYSILLLGLALKNVKAIKYDNETMEPASLQLLNFQLRYPVSTNLAVKLDLT